MLHFAYGSNMSRPLMRGRCPTATALGTARLPGWRFVVTRDGYASIVPAPGAQVHGVLWRLCPRDLAALNAYESLDSGLYSRRVLAVRWNGRRAAALIYLARARPRGRPRPGYQEIIVAAARDWRLPDRYIEVLEQWVASGLRAARPAETGEIGWAKESSA